MRNENATFLHNFALPCLHIIRKSLTICVFAGLTRNLILAFSNATRCVSTRLIGWDAGSSPAGHEGQKYPRLFHGDCSTKVNLFVEQSAPSPIPRQNRLSSVYEDCSPWNILRNAPQNARKKAVLAPFAPFYSTYLFVEQCSTNVPRNPVLCSIMIINRLTKIDCATKFRGTLCSTPLFPMFHGMFHETHCAIKWSSLFHFSHPFFPFT